MPSHRTLIHVFVLRRAFSVTNSRLKKVLLNQSGGGKLGESVVDKE